MLEHLEDATDNHTNPTYCGVRTSDWKYIASATGEEELYDLVADPFELRNVARSPLYAAQRQALLARTTALCNPLPPDPTFQLPPV